MGVIEEKRQKIIEEMEAGRGSAEILDHPVSLEPAFTPFSTRPERASFLNSLFSEIKKKHTKRSEIYNSNPCWRFIRIKPSPDDKNSLEIAEQFILSLPDSNPIGFEIIGHHKKICFQMTVEESQTDVVVSQFRSHFPSADVCTQDEDEIRYAMPSHPVAHAYRLKSSHFFPLSLVTDKGIDPLRSLCGFLGDLKEGQRGIFQVLTAPVIHDWPDNMRRASRNPYDPAASVFIDQPGLPKLVDKKLSKPLFVLSLRMFASDQAMLTAMEIFLKQFDNGENGLTPVPGTYPIDSIIRRNTFVHGIIVNSTELSYFLHLPSTEILDTIPCIERATKSYPVPDEFCANGPVLGINMYRGIKKMVCHSSSLLNGHIYICGSTGSGKSYLLLNIIIQLIAEKLGFAVLDPHGRLVENDVLPRIPKDRIADVVLIDPADTAYPVALNPLQHDGSKLAKEQIRADLMDFLQLLFEDSFGVNIQHSLNFALLTLLQNNNATLLDLERIIIDKNWRSNFLEEVQDDRIHAFWDMEFPLLEKRGIVTALTNKLSILTAPDSIVAPMLSSPDSKINIPDIMNQGKIFLANLAQGRIGKRNSRLISKICMSQFSVSAMMRQKEEKYPDYFIVADELHEQSSQSCAHILSATRKYGLHIVAANQSPSDLPGDILRHILNAAVLIAFNTDYPPDQMILEKSFSRKVKAEAFGNLQRGQAFVKMGTSVFDMNTLRVSDPPAVHWIDEIIAESRAKYSRSENSCRSVSEKTYKTKRRESTHPEPKTTSDRQTDSSLSANEQSFLKCVFQNPTISVTGIYRNQNLSAYMGDKIKTALKDKNLLQEVKTHLGSGSRIAKFLLLTPQGFNALGSDFNPENGKGNALHRYWQKTIQFHAKSAGYGAVIEEPVSGCKETVDLGLHRNGERMAIEISVTTNAEQEVNNIVKCLKAGYDKVISLHVEENKMMELNGLVKNSFTTEEQSRITIGLVYDFCSFCK